MKNSIHFINFTALLYRLILFFFLQFLSLHCFPDNIKNYKFHTLSPEGGFYYDGIKSIQQDSKGFIWVIMADNLFRFDGYQFKSYYPHFQMLDPSDGNWHFNEAETDADGRLFIATNKGLFRYDQITDTFKRIFQPEIRNLKIDSRKNLWLVSSSLGILDLQNNSFNQYSSSSGPLTNVTDLCSDEKELVAGTSKGEVFLFDYNQKLFNHFCSIPEQSFIIKIKRSKNLLWVLSENHGLYTIDYNTSSIINHYDFFCTLNNASVPAKALYIDKNGYVWIGTQRGLYIMNPQTQEYTHFTNSETELFSLPSNSVWTIKEDTQNNVWIGTYSGGLCYLNFQEAYRFHTYKPHEKGLNHKVVSSFAEDSNYLWIATEGGGINKMNKKNGKFQYYTHIPGQNSLAYDNVKSLAVDSSQNLWIAMFRGGLDCLSIKDSTFKNYSYDNHADNGLLSMNLKKIVLEADSGLWISYQDIGISFFSFKNKRFTHYKFDENKHSKNNSISDLCRGEKDDLWIINKGALYYMNVRNKKYRKITPDSTPDLQIQTLCRDLSGNIWLGTRGSGLIRYNIANNHFYPIKDILYQDVSTIYSLCVDDNNDIWLGTDNGLFKYEMKKNTFWSFDKKEGVQGSCFYPYACLKGKNGELYFGGTSGFTIINPKEWKLNNFMATAIVTDFYIDNVVVKPDTINSPLRQSIFSTKEITLDHNQINFGFKISSNNYLVPEKNRFKYRLVGYDDRWVEIDASNRLVSYSKIPPGTYSFEVLTSNNDGVWNKEPTVINIKRLPAPWYSWWAYLLYIFISIIIICIIFYNYSRQKRLKLQLYMETMEMQKKEENHQAQLRFFTNISHDFRTPLSLIMAAVERIQQSYGNNQYTKLLNNNVRRLMNLVNELMDFRAVENGKMKLKVQLADINQFVEEISADFLDYAAQKGINFVVATDSSLPATVFFDKHIMEKIIMNLLNNAFKYTNHDGHISIEVHHSINNFQPKYQNHYKISNLPDSDNSFYLIIRDTGVGISAESIAQVFERFYKVADTESHLGSGIGLALVKSLVLLHKGSIAIYSERNKGTEFVVEFPLGIDSYSSNEQAEHVDDSNLDSYSIDIEQSISLVSDNKEDESFLLREQKRILLVEDNENLRTLIAQSLRSFFEVVEANNGMEALEIINKTEIDIIISDIMMPLKDGITLCKEIKENINYSHLPFILLTAKSGLPNQIEGLSTGADAYLEKPINFKLLHLIIQNIFKQQKNLREYYAKSHFLDNTEVTINRHDNEFICQLIKIIDKKIDQPDMDVNYIASEFSMSRSKLYSKVKSITDKSIIEFIRSYRLQKAASFLVEENLSIRETMERIGIESQSYFTRIFKNEFGISPAQFVQTHKKRRDDTIKNA